MIVDIKFVGFLIGSLKDFYVRHIILDAHSSHVIVKNIMTAEPNRNQALLLLYLRGSMDTRDQ